jgi:hypothetical protein
MHKSIVEQDIYIKFFQCNISCVRSLLTITSLLLVVYHVEGIESFFFLVEYPCNIFSLLSRNQNDRS